MADYPSYTSIPQSGKSRRFPLGDGVIIDLAASGGIRGVKHQTIQPYRFDLMHERIPVADADTITAHYASEGATAFNFVWAFDLATYVCRYQGVEPLVEPITGAGTAIANVTVQLVGTKV